MLVLYANQKQEAVFNKLIQSMGGQVAWEGRFAIMDDWLVLEGAIRSLCFQFSIKKVEAELIELPEKEGEALEVSEHMRLLDVLSMAVYAFGKWGKLKGVHIKQEMEQLNQLFGKVLGPYHIEPAFSWDSFQFYKDGIRITYEDVIRTVLGLEEKLGRILDESLLEPGLALSGIEWGQESAEESAAPPSALPAAKKPAVGRDKKEVENRIQKFHARIGVLDRLSERQKIELKRDIRNDNLLNTYEKMELQKPIDEYAYQMRLYALEKDLADEKNQNYAFVCKRKKNLDKEDILDKYKQMLEEKLDSLGEQFAVQEVSKIMDAMPNHVERTEFDELREKLAPYDEKHLGPYREKLRKMRETLEIKEISNLLVQSPKESRADYVTLLRKMEERGFAPENAVPYIERVLEWIREIDESRLKELMYYVQAMDFDAAAGAYEQIGQESFLPQLRAKALAVLAKRMKKIRMDEGMQLVQKFRESMPQEMRENPRHHFFAAGMAPEEARVMDAALSAYAEERGQFEYPLFMVDTSKSLNGGEGMLLTPEHLFYSTRLNGYQVAVPAVKSVQLSAGLLKNRKLILEEANGARHKLPYAVEQEQMQDWAAILEQFIRYLQKRKVSAKLAYSAQEKTEMSACGRCGCVYPKQETCPECGYHNG